jgi:hypothetical protein
MIALTVTGSSGGGFMATELGNGHCRALELLSVLGPHGRTETMLMATGFKLELLTDLVQSGLVSTPANSVPTGEHVFAVKRLRITDAGQQALAQLSM